ncbi:hypothetical protein [Deinococcus koreensis]|uniref:Uncharacterized protein n=1 Tax=Deinococcus koreensis TaxID=2054903 RepID=A0A2K3V1A6_9DEIO|nr:hypothetical protein [Deinococcus koreensis]PNY82563.1 hypothetical protein CVO96_15475 [Deinococcus koreensis]
MPTMPPSALARPLDFTHSSNRVAVLGSLGALLLARRRTGSWKEAVNVAGACFLAWATARELDPDHPWTANLALPLAFMLVVRGAANPLPAAGTMSGLRMLAGTTGEAPTPVDTAAMLAQTGLSARFGGRLGALLPALAPWLSQRQETAALSLLGLLVPPVPASTGGGSVWPVLGALALAPWLIRPESIASSCDRAARPVRDSDVQQARSAALAVLGAAVLSRRHQAQQPLAAAVLTVGLRRLTSP